LLIIDCDSHLAKQASAVNITQWNIWFWFEELGELDAMAVQQICYML